MSDEHEPKFRISLSAPTLEGEIASAFFIGGQEVEPAFFAMAISEEVQALEAQVRELEAKRDGWRAQAEATAREARACFDAQREIDEAWDQIGTRGNKGTLSLPEQLASIFREDETALAAERETVARLREALALHACDCTGRCAEFEWMPAGNAVCARYKARAALASVQTVAPLRTTLAAERETTARWREALGAALAAVQAQEGEG